jgi:multiple sugar transport system substrate-binding protein
MKKLLVLFTVFVLLGLIAACVPVAPQVIEREVVVTQEVEKIVKETVVVEVEKAAEEAPEGMPFQGVTLRIATTDALGAIAAQHELLDDEYRELSGVDLVVDILPFNDLLAKLTTMCNAGSDEYDAMWLDGPWYGSFVDPGCLELLDPYIKNDPEEISMDTFPIRTVAYQAVRGDHIWIIPEFHAVGMFSYRKDLFEDPDMQAEFQEQYGRELAVPEDWEQWLETAQFFTRPDEQLWGTSHRYGSPNNIIADMLIGVAFARGATLFDENFEPTMNTPEWQDSANFFLGEEFLATQPPGAESFTFAEVIQNMMQGKVAMYTTENWAIPTLKDPNISPNAENTDFALVPGWRDPDGEIHRGTMIGAGGYAINSQSQHKEAAWDYLKFLLGKTNAPKVTADGGWAIRTTQYTDPAVLEQFPYLATNYEQVKVSIARPDEPWWPEVEFAIGKELEQALLREKTVGEALQDADTTVRDIVAGYGYYDSPRRYYQSEEKEAIACQVLKNLGVDHPDCE